MLLHKNNYFDSSYTMAVFFPSHTGKMLQHLRTYFWHLFVVLNFVMMDEILDVCFDKGLYLTLLQHSKRATEKEIPTRSPFKFTNVLHPIYETQNIYKDELAKLNCRSTHEIKTYDSSVKEENILHHIFAVESGGSRGTSTFMRTWLHLFVRMHQKFFTTLGMKYFNSKSMTLVIWMEGILDGQKGDVLVLHGLCLLIERHAWGHLKDNKVWTSLKTSPKLHAHVMDQCNLHLAYLDRGIFATLIKRPESSDGTVISTDTALSANETLTIDLLTLAGLSVG